MNRVLITKIVEAWQWDGSTADLPEGFHACVPEVHYSADGTLVYFTYADLRSGFWMEVVERPDEPQEDSTFNGGFKVTLKDGRTYYRLTYPFSFWAVKSRASATNDHKPVYLDKNDEAQMRLFLDYADVSKWFMDINLSDGREIKNLPARLEFRRLDGAYGRGYKPFYMKPTDWLVKDEGQYRVMSSADFDKIQK